MKFRLTSLESFKMVTKETSDSIEYSWYDGNIKVANILIDKEPAIDGYRWFGSLYVNKKYRNKGIRISKVCN